jgi:hypothetical protein
MRVAFAIWDPPLQQLCNVCPQLYGALAHALFRTLCKMPAESMCANGPADDSDNDYGDAEKQATMQWLRRMLHSTEWRGVRKRDCDFSRRDLTWELMAKVIEHPLPSTLRFGEYLLKSAVGSTYEYWAKYYHAARGPKWKWRREGRNFVEDESEEEPGGPAAAGGRKRSLEDVDAEDGPGEEDGAGDAAKHRKVDSVQTTRWDVPIGSVPVTRTVTVPNVGDV